MISDVHRIWKSMHEFDLFICWWFSQVFDFISWLPYFYWKDSIVLFKNFQSSGGCRIYLFQIILNMNFRNSKSRTTLEIEYFYFDLFSVSNMKMYSFLHSIQSIFISIFCIIFPRWSSQSSAIIIPYFRIIYETNFHSNSDRKDVVQTTSQHRATSLYQNCK